MKTNRHLFFIKLASAITIILATPLAFSLSPIAAASGSLDSWWPTDGAHVTGTQPFKAVLEGYDVNTYDMYWQVDGGQLNPMQTSTTDAPHKEASVDVSGWNWKGAGPYAITYLAKQNGAVIAQKTVSIYIGAGTSDAGSTASTPTAQSQASTVTLSPLTTMTGTASLSVEWPTSGSAVSGLQTFKATVPSASVDSYTMYWQVDNGAQNLMATSYAGTPHKEANVDLSGWNWQPSGTYTLTFTAKDGAGNIFASYSEPITVNAGAQTNTASSQPAPATQPTQQTQPAQTLSGSAFYVDPNSNAAKQADAWASSRPSDAAAMRTLASAPTARWFGEWSGDVGQAVSSYVGAAASAGKTAVLVAYDIPQRDCGGYSAGGANDYLSWITSFANGIGSNKAVVILEPDSLAQMSCLSSGDQANRYSLLSKAVGILKQHGNTKVYLDAGHAGWVDAGTMASRLSQANVAAADGFALNVSNYDATPSETAYGQSVSQNLSGKHFIIDTSRNGNGSNGEWCNASGRAIGAAPTTSTGSSLVDAFLWVKTPGESDGTCNGGPSAGTWWPDYALSLVKNAH